MDAAMARLGVACRPGVWRWGICMRGAGSVVVVVVVVMLAALC